jgi:two-component system response regulator MtrA
MDEKVLLVEDDAAIRDITSRGLQQAGYDVTTESDGRQALMRIRSQPFEAVILDVMLPGLDGIEICRQARHDSQVPIVMLTARTETIDIVSGLEAGADDYLTKPFEIPELLARLRAVLRRTSSEPNSKKIAVADLEIDGAAFKAFKRGGPLTLTTTEFKLLYELARHVGQVMTREMLLELVWDYDYLGDSRVVDMAVKRLREKIEAALDTDSKDDWRKDRAGSFPMATNNRFRRRCRRFGRRHSRWVIRLGQKRSKNELRRALHKRRTSSREFCRDNARGRCNRAG